MPRKIWSSKLAQVEEAREAALAEIQTALKQALQANEEALANRTAALEEEAQRAARGH